MITWVTIPFKTRTARPVNARRQAFTLIELMISAAIMSLVLGAAYACLQAGVTGRRTTEWRSSAVQKARVCLQQIAADLRSACPLAPEREFIGQDHTLRGAEADLLDFATHHYTPRQPREGDICEISYFLEEDPKQDGFRLWRRRDASPDLEPMGGGLRELLADGLQGLRFEYYDGWDWYDEWGDPEGRQRGTSLTQLPLNASGLPEAVRISIWINPEPAPRLGQADMSRSGQIPETKSEASLMFQTVARLNLAPLATTAQSAGAAGSESTANSSQGGTP